MLTNEKIRKALLESTETGHFVGVDGPFGWQAKLEHEYETKWEGTLWHDGHGLTIQCIIAANDAAQAAERGANYMLRYHNLDLYPKRPGDKIRDWYMSTCPTDECGKDIDEDATFIKYVLSIAMYGSPYIYGIDDSLVRQRVMAAASHCCDVPYDLLCEFID